jgi:hypothetical protein
MSMPVYRNEKDGCRYIGYDPDNFKDFLKFRCIINSIADEPVLKTDLIIDALIPAQLNQWELSALSVIINRYKKEKPNLIIRVEKNDAVKLSNMLGGGTANIRVIAETCT